MSCLAIVSFFEFIQLALFFYLVIYTCNMQTDNNINSRNQLPNEHCPICFFSVRKIQINIFLRLNAKLDLIKLIKLVI